MPWETPNWPTPIWIVPACGPDTLAQHNLTQQMAEFNVKYHTQEKKGIGDSPPATRTTGTNCLPAKASIAVALLSGLALIALLTLRHKIRIAEKKIELLKQENELNRHAVTLKVLEEEKYFAKELHDGIKQRPAGAANEDRNFCRQRNEQELASLVSN